MVMAQVVWKQEFPPNYTGTPIAFPMPETYKVIGFRRNEYTNLFEFWYYFACEQESIGQTLQPALSIQLFRVAATGENFDSDWAWCSMTYDNAYIWHLLKSVA